MKTELHNPRLYLLFNHSFTKAQIEAARSQLGVDHVVELPEALKELWGHIPPESDSLFDCLETFRVWLDSEARDGDYVLIQGDFGATYLMVNFSLERRLIPIYSTTNRDAVEEQQEDGAIRLGTQLQALHIPHIREVNMARAFISILGTNDYLPCTYYMDGHDSVAGVRFVQEALGGMLLQDWTGEDRILVFTTDEAWRKNWKDDGHTGRDGKVLIRSGLGRCLESLCLRPRLVRVPIPDGKTEDEIWTIFDTIYEHLNPFDELIFDVTHAFRSLPILTFAVLNYARSLKSVTLGGIYYGAFEVLGSIFVAREIPEEKRRVPIFDLTSFDRLMRWSLAVDRFVTSGDSGMLSNVADEAARVHLKETKGRHPSAASLRRIAKEVHEFTDAINSCRGPRLSDISRNLSSAIEDYEQENLVKPFRPIFHRLKEHMRGFGRSDLGDGIECAKWCLEHNLLQQGYTILQETVISWMLGEIGEASNDINARQAVGSAFHTCFDRIKGNGVSSITMEATPIQRRIIESVIAVIETRRIWSKSMKI